MKSIAEKPLIIAHRGASALAPENTLAAFGQAIRDGAEGIELDVRLAKDGVPVVIHDADLKRLADKKGHISSYTSRELQSFDVGSWFNSQFPKKADDQFSRETVPTFPQLLKFLEDYKGLIYVEIKCKKAETDSLVRAVCQLIEQTNLLSQIVLKSFNLGALILARNFLPEVRTAALFSPKILRVVRKRKHILQKAEKCGANEISLHYSLATRGLVERAKDKGLATVIWTADSFIWVKRALDLGIYAVITNNPAHLLAKKQKLFAKQHK
ncbi:MAG: glycerophosphodiester phosphodiesterase family protein [Pyrinomonadaceae bacterium]